MIDLSQLTVGREYDRPTLARMWGYRSFQAISRGVVSPKGESVLVLFVTKEKQESLTQYEDHIDADILFWEGEKEHGSDARILERRDIIGVFYRLRHHSNFTYQGRAALQTYHLYSDRPSKFVFGLIDKKIEVADILAEISQRYDVPETEREAIIKSRVGQGLFRNKAIELWKTCSVTSFTKANVLVASHIKPWKLSSNEERLSPHNSLLLVPTLDKLFDSGYIGFEPSGKIMLSSKIIDDDWKRVGVNSNLRLRTVPEETKKYLVYHGEYIYDLVSG